MAEGEIASATAATQETPRIDAIIRGRKSQGRVLPRITEGDGPPDTLISEFQRPALLENKSLLFEATQLWYFVTTVLRN